MRGRLAAVVVAFSLALSFGAMTACSDDDGEICDNGIDDDGDGYADCDDPSCANSAACASVCGDDVADGAELCDGADLDGNSCATEGFDAGDLACNATCDGLDDTQCFDTECGDDIAEGNEECDGADLDSTNCTTLGYTGGILACDGGCLFDESGCTNTTVTCGDGVAEGDEECDDNGVDEPDFLSQTCGDFSFDRGWLTCSSTCTIETTSCGYDLGVCMDTGTDTLDATGQVTCADDTQTLDFDWYAVPVTAGDCVHIKADNGAGAADLFAIAIDADGVTMYGFVPDYSELDDEFTCTTPNWAGYDCPEASVTAATTGDLMVLIGQWGGGCAAGMSDYTLTVAVNGTDVAVTMSADDTPLQ